MDGGPSKINPCNSHPSNPIHKAATQPTPEKPPIEPEKLAIEEKTPKHEINKTSVIIGVFAFVALLFMASR